MVPRVPQRIKQPYKWDKGKHGIRGGTIVILREDNVPFMHWPLGRVIKVHPGADGIVRAATVKTATNILDRGVKRLIPLPCQPEPEKPGQPRTAENAEERSPWYHPWTFDRGSLNGRLLLRRVKRSVRRPFMSDRQGPSIVREPSIDLRHTINQVSLARRNFGSCKY